MDGIENALSNSALKIDQVRHAHWRGESGQGLLARDLHVLTQFESELPWGVETSIDLFGCDPASIRNEHTIRAFALALCDFIQMKRYGEPLIVHFGAEERVSGYSLVQLIETSDITSHFIEQVNAACISIFSCAAYPPYHAAAFCQTWFGAQEVRVSVVFRGPRQPGVHGDAAGGAGASGEAGMQEKDGSASCSTNS